MTEISNSTIPETIGAVSARRIGFVDGFRGIAILLVLGYHYFHRWAGRGYYPYGDVLADFPLFAIGHYGVQLFFAVSGFVIAMTLERTGSFAEFAVKRFARLWPAMLVCSCISFAFLKWQPIYFPQSPKNFVSSLTFLSGDVVWYRLFPGFNSGWIDGAYWSLFVEVRFYALAATCYYLSGSRFRQVFAVGSACAVSMYCLASLYQLPGVAKLLSDVAIPQHLPWFLLGLSMYERWSGNYGKSNQTLGISMLCIVLIASADTTWPDVITFIMVATAFLACLKFDAVNRIFSASWLTFVGICSYSLYLLHQNVGVTLISLIASRLSLGQNASLIVPFAVAAGMLLVASLLYRFWEHPMNKLIVKRSRLRQTRKIQEQGA
jgi:peptidoglycan/LPS O-acetylase OafA/YrhL